MRPPPAALILLFLIGFSPITTLAQDSPLMRVGDRVRIRILEGQPYSHSLEGPQVGSGSAVLGNVRFVTETVIVVGVKGGEWEIPTSSIEVAQVSVGQKSKTLQGLGLGVLIGGGLGVAIGFIAGDDPTLPFWGIVPFTAEEKARRLCGLGAVIGGVVGVITGAMMESDLWEDVSFSGVKASVQMGSSGRFGLGFSIPLIR